MPKKAKIGKNRKDKFYSIAKEVGYRARSAFKLVQLNRKFQFLQNSRVLIDLCAAPGGWLQVAKQHMPVESKICGVDLVPIKQITGVTTFQDDITTDSCRSKLRAYLKDWKADVVLNDGAPNVGKNWHLDAFSQSELTLKACQLAAFSLRPGGWFITKVFRSNDYNGLIWVLKQLFKKVHATKPAASRNESAEIFVVCQGYLNPSKIDPKFFDIKTALAQVESDQKQIQFKDFEGGKKRKAVGYEDGATVLYKEKTEMEFFEADVPLEFLYNINKIIINQEHEKEYPELYNDDLKDYCNDIKVVEKKGVKKLLKWREKMRVALGLEENSDADNEDNDMEDENVDSDEEEMKQMEKEELQHMKDQFKDLRGKKKKREKSLKKLRDLIGNTVKLDQVEDIELFNLKQMNSKVKNADLEEEANQSSEGSSDEQELESGDEEHLPEHLNDTTRQFDLDEETNELIVPLEKKEVIQDRATQQWFGNSDWFDGLENGSEVDQSNINQILKGKNNETKEKTKDQEKKKEQEINDDDQMEIEVSKEAHNQETDEADSTDYETESDDSEDERQRLHLREMEARIGSIPERREDKLSKRKRLEEARKKEEFPLTPEQLAIATEIVTSKKKRRDYEEMMYDKVSFNDPEGLPEWFTDEEKKHRFRRPPALSKELVAMYKERQKEANVKTIKKIAEAKARKKRKAAKKMESARKAAEGVLNQEDVSAREKSAQIKRIYNKAGVKKEKEHITYVPVKQGAGKKVSRPAGVKGKFKVVDRRMKSEMRAEKAKERRQGKRSSGGRGLNSMNRKSLRR